MEVAVAQGRPTGLSPARNLWFICTVLFVCPCAGLPRDNNWVLHGPENDRTLGMRNWLGYNMARWMGRYASRTQYFELFLNTVRLKLLDSKQSCCRRRRAAPFMLPSGQRQLIPSQRPGALQALRCLNAAYQFLR
jgi:hypothetical protein